MEMVGKFLLVLCVLPVLSTTAATSTAATATATATAAATATTATTAVMPVVSDWSAWTACIDVNGGGRTGEMTRSRDCLDDLGTIASWDACNCSCSNNETRRCFLPVDGAWGSWGSWTCVKREFQRFRSCNSPAPAHGGSDCNGNSSQTDLGLYVDGGWTSWTNFSTCNVPMGHGIQYQTRECSNPPTCGPLAQDCQGANYTERACEVFPSCLQGSVFGGNYMTKADPLVLYSSANIEILPKTQIKCRMSFPSRNWTLYRCDENIDNETEYYASSTTAFLIRPGEFPSGVYRLFVRIEYFPGSYEFVEGYMYFRLQLPPPNVIIQGGSGRMSGPGATNIDAWSGSYDLTKGPGHRDGMTFTWSCLEFPTDSLDMLMTLVLSESFSSSTNETVSWDFMKELTKMSEQYLNLFPSKSRVFFNYTYIHLNLENISSPQSCDNYGTNSLSNPCFVGNVMGVEMYSFLEMFINTSFVQEVLVQKDVVKKVITDITSALPMLKLQSDITTQEIDTIETSLLPSMESLKQQTEHISSHLTELNNLFYDTSNFTVSILQRVDKQLVYLTKRTTEILALNISDMAAWEADAWNLIISLYESSKCTSFSETATGYAEVFTDPGIRKAVGYIITVEASVQGADNTYQQRIQVIFPNSSTSGFTSNTVPDINVKCMLNCKKKVATSLVMSMKVECTSCSADDLDKAVYSWNLMRFDPITRTVSDIPDWENWLRTDPSEMKLFVYANSFSGLSYYLLTIRMNITDDRWTEMQMILETTEPPYGGYCRFEYKQKTGQRVLAINSWKDEGFRKQKNADIDWKEQISFRILQEDSQTKEKTLLYQGNERYLENIYFNYGHLEDNWLITVYVEVLDVFDDFTTCYFNRLQILSPITGKTLDDYLQDSQELIETAIDQEDVGLVSMAIETTISTTNRVDLPPQTLIDTLVEDPESWSNVGDGGTFDSLFQDITVTPEVNSTHMMLIEGMKNMTSLLAISTSSLKIDNTVRQRQMAFSSGSAMENKQLMTRDAMIYSLNATNDVIVNFINTSKEALFPVYEDYLSTSEAVLRSLDNLLNNLIPKLSPDIPESDDIYQIADEYAASDLINEYDGSGFSPQERALFASMSLPSYQQNLNSSLEMANGTVPSVQNSVVELGTVLKEIAYRKQFEVEVTRPTLTTSMEKLRVDKEVDRRDLKIKFDINSTQQEDLQVTKFLKTPFIWDSEAKNIHSPTVHIVLGNRTKLPSVKTKFSVSPSVTKRDVILALPDDPEEYSSQSFYYKIWWKNPSDNLVFSVECENRSMDTISHVVYVKQGGNPTSSNHELTKTITNSDWNDGFTYILPANFYSKPCIVYFAVHITSTPKLRPSRRRRSVYSVYNSTSSVTYRVGGWTTGCRVWDGGKWDKSSCQLSPETNGMETVCECKNPPGDNFATSFFVPPNSIDFSTVFDKFDILGNGAVFGTVTAIIVLYLIGLLITRRFDKKDQEKWKLFYMNDNLKTDKRVYLVTVYTGLSRNSGTKSNVSFVLGGHLRDTGTRHLSDGVRKGFETGSVYTYVMTVQNRLGDLIFLNIWHDNSGRGADASWNLVKVVVEDAQTGRRFVFFCNQWLSLDSEESSIQCTVNVATPESLRTFNFNFTENTRENATDSHLWLSVLFRPERSSFNRCERLSCCVTLLFLTMISNAMFYGQDEAVERLRIGPIKFALSSIYISFIGIAITFPVILAITMIFRKSKWSENPPDHDELHIETFQKQKEIKEFRLPKKLVYVAYVLIAVSILVSGFFVILYSMEWGKTKSEEWLKTFFLSFLESMFVVDPIKVLALAVFVSIAMKRALNDSMYDATKLLEYSQSKAVAFARETQMSYCHRAPFNNETLETMKRKRLKEMRVKRIFVELLLYLCFLAILYFISYNNRDFNSFQIRDYLNKRLLHSPDKNSSLHTIRYDKVRDVDSFYDWLKNTLLPFTFPQMSYNGQPLNAFERQFTADQDNYRLGPIRLRQLRVEKENCHINLIADATCYADYFISTEDVRSDCQSWGLFSCDNNNTQMSSKAWQFTSATEVWGIPTIGLTGTYGGGGYMADLGIHLMYANRIVDELFRNTWIDRQTRAVFVEFTQYNSNINLFTYISLMAEFPQTGGVFTTAHIYPLRVYQYIGNFGVFIFLCEIVVAICAIAFFAHYLVQIVKHKHAFLKDTWRLFDLVIIVLTIVTVSMYITRMLFTSWTITKFTEQKLKFVNFGHIALWDEILNAFISFLVFLTTLRILRILNYSHNITQLAGVLSNARSNLMGCFLMFGLIFMAYAGVGYLLFGAHLETYKNIFVSITTIVNSLIGRNSLHGLIQTSPIIAEIYYFTFVMFVIWIVMTMLNATLNRSIEEIRTNMKKTEEKYGVDDLLHNFLQDFWHKINFKFQKSSGKTSLRRRTTSLTSRDVDLLLEDIDAISYNDDE